MVKDTIAIAGFWAVVVNQSKHDYSVCSQIAESGMVFHQYFRITEATLSLLRSLTSFFKYRWDVVPFKTLTALIQSLFFIPSREIFSSRTIFPLQWCQFGSIRFFTLQIMLDIELITNHVRYFLDHFLTKRLFTFKCSRPLATTIHLCFSIQSRLFC